MSSTGASPTIALLRDSTGATIPVGHLHTPVLSPPSSNIAAFHTARDTIVARIRQILTDTIPSL
jgi:hypothetical protein